MTKEQKDEIAKLLADERNAYVKECNRQIAAEHGKIIGADYMLQRFIDIKDVLNHPTSTTIESPYTGRKYYAYWCPNCSENINKVTSERVCRYCGQKINWEV